MRTFGDITADKSEYLDKLNRYKKTIEEANPGKTVNIFEIEEGVRHPNYL